MHTKHESWKFIPGQNEQNENTKKIYEKKISNTRKKTITEKRKKNWNTFMHE